MAVSDYLQLAMPAINFGKGILGIGENALITDAMREQLVQRAKETELNKGSLGYEAFGLPTSSKGGRFSGGLFDLALKDPVAFANVGSVGRVSFEKDPTQPGGYRFGDIKYDFTPDKNTGSTGNKILDFINEGGLAKKIADSNLSKTLSNLVFTPAGAAEVQSKNPFNNMVSDTVLAEPKGQSQFQDYPGVENLGGVQNFDLEEVQDIISRMEEEKGNYIEKPQNRFNMDGIMQNLKNYGKDAAGRYAASQFLGGAGNMIGGPTIGGIAAIAGLLGGGNLFNQPYMGAEGYTMDQYGNMYTAGQLNKMNALGGYYTEQARDSRRRDQEIKNMIERKNQGLRYGINRLAQLQKEKEREEAARRTSGGNYLTGGGGDTFSFSDNSGYGGTGTASPSNVGAGGRLGGGV